MEPILRSHFVNFKENFEIVTGDDPRREAEAFERFVNYTLLSVDYPDAFEADTELLEVVSVGGGDDTFLDGIGIAINDRLVRSIDEINEIVESSKKLSVDFVFIQSKMRPKFDMAELNCFGTGVKLFFSPPTLPQNARVSDFRELRNYIYSNEKVISKLSSNPNLRLYFVGTGNEPDNSHFTEIRNVITDSLSRQTECYFGSVELLIIDAKQLVKLCRELANSFDVQINIRDILPLSVEADADIKKAYAFTCNASEFLKVLSKDDGSLRRSLFNDNVRDYLGNAGNINREIEETIINNPEMFLLCNNGVTVVCEEFDQIRDKLVRIENPQIVNGCQTSNTIFSLRTHPNISKIQLLVRVICTENRVVSNRIVRGTNRQNQVLEEAFEATLPFHQETLEPYFAARSGPVKLYYERRARQYNNDPLVKKTQVVNLRIMTQTFVGMFLDAPHESHRHEAKLLEKYAGESGTRLIFREDHSPVPYFACSLAWYMLEKYFRDDSINKKYKTYKAHLLLIMRYAVSAVVPRLAKSKAADHFGEQLLLMLDEPHFGDHVRHIVRVFEATLQLWIDHGGSPYGVKDSEKFTELLITQAKRKFVSIEREPVREDLPELNEGRVLRVILRNGLWFGFINRGAGLENVYLDSRGYSGDSADLTPDRPVRFDIGKNERGGLFAFNVVITGDSLCAVSAP